MTGPEDIFSKIGLATEIDRAIDLSCRACGAMAMGAGLGFPVGVSAPLRFHPQPPILNFVVEPSVRGWGWKRNGAETPTGNPSPGPIAIAPHARHDRSMARNFWRLGRSEAYFLPLQGCHENTSRVHSESITPFRSFEQGIIMVFLWTHLWTHYLRFILARNYIVFVGGHGFFSSSEPPF